MNLVHVKHFLYSLSHSKNALNSQIERNIQAAVGNVCEHKTSIIIARQLHTITHIDGVHVLMDGEIITW